jgi:alpha-L-fucosidase
MERWLNQIKVSRRRVLLGTGATAASLAAASFGQTSTQAPDKRAPALTPPSADQVRRMRWWHEAKFGMFVHFGLYSQHARHEWAMEDEAIPIGEYTPLAQMFDPAPGFARGWAKLAKATGMKYMVMTTKHHEGFCNFDTKLTDYCATKAGPKRDLVREYVEAARAEGLRVGFYYSLMDWHHPDGARCATDEAARKRFVEYTHGLIRELLTNYGKIDVLWYDVSWPLDAAGWESERMNRMVFELQPDIIVNNRNQLPDVYDALYLIASSALESTSADLCQVSFEICWFFPLRLCTPLVEGAVAGIVRLVGQYHVPCRGSHQIDLRSHLDIKTVDSGESTCATITTCPPSITPK